MTITNKPNYLLAIGLPLFIFCACFIITLSSKFKLNEALLSNAVLIDLLITAPLVYLWTIRKTTVSKLTVTRVFIAGLFVAGLILNTHNNGLLDVLKKWVSPIIEAWVIFFIGRKFYVANKQAKQSDNSIDFLTHCRMLMFDVIGNEKAGNIIASEIAVLYYAFISTKDKTVNYSNKFSSYKENGILLILGTFLCIFLIETTGVHFLLRMWNSNAAWVITVLSFYTCMQLYAHMKAVKARPIQLTADAINIHNGLAGDALIIYNNIEKIELNNKQPNSANAIKIALIIGLENHNCIIYLKQPIQVTKVFGIKKQADTILFFVDQPKLFMASVQLKLIQ